MRFYLVDFKLLLYVEECSVTFNFKLKKYWLGKDFSFKNYDYYNFVDFLNEAKHLIKFNILTDEEVNQLEYSNKKGFISKYNPYFDLDEEELFYYKLKYGDVFDKLFTGN